ncbi:response regulator [Halopelagius fulvigenes]|uniref:Response regulator n=1 Tax=Halopelagius fulvigenes TaxID=1198324 RepID=A0ABD5U447_9EURY
MSRNPNPGDEPLRVLVVEDNPGDVWLIEEAFEGLDVENSVTFLTDGEDALDFLLRRLGGDAGGLDLAILDLNVPKIDGRTILERIASDSDLHSTSVVVFSGSRSPDDIRETYELGAEGYFVKPADPDRFIETVRTIGESAADAGRLPPGEFRKLV